MKNELIELQEKFRPYLRNGDYSFIAPIDNDNYDRFLYNVTEIAPGQLFNKSIHNALSNEDATTKALEQIPNSIPVQIYVVTRFENDNDIIAKSTIEEYCESHKIKFNPS